MENGTLLGFGSANPCTEESFDTGSYTTYQGRALAVVRAEVPGKTSAQARADAGDKADEECKHGNPSLFHSVLVISDAFPGCGQGEKQQCLVIVPGVFGKS